MGHIKVKEGLNIPIKGQPVGAIQSLPKPKRVALNLSPFAETKFKLLVKAGERVKLGEPVLADKSCEGRYFVAPGAGIIQEVRRGLKRRILDVVIQLDDEEERHTWEKMDPANASWEEILKRLKEGGLTPHIRQRPFNRMCDPQKRPRSIFVKAVDSAPFDPSAEMQVEGYEKEFQAGLTALSRLVDGGALHLVYHQDSDFQPFTQAEQCERHTVGGLHPCGESSVHIHHIDPVQGVEDSIWTLSASHVVQVGMLLLQGVYHTDRVVAVAGPGIIEGRTGFFRCREGFPVEGLVANRTENGLARMISGNPLTGQKVEGEDFLGFYHTAFTVIPENTSRELLHFFRLGAHKFTASQTYLSGFLDQSDKEYAFTTNNHGEERAFVDGGIYDAVMPMQVPTMHLVKALMAEDYELAEELGALEVTAEDFALAEFVCPCKIPMGEIVRDKLEEFAAEVFG